MIVDAKTLRCSQKSFNFEILPIRISVIFRAPDVKPPRIQPIAAISNETTRVGFLPQWLINQMLTREGVSTRADKMKARYTF